MDRFAELDTFVAIVEAGSLSGAAERLGIAVSAVSRRLGELETRLGVRLANRSSRGLAPTPSGEAYYDRALALLGALEEADASVTGARAARTGTLRIALPLSYGLRVVAPILHRFAAERPGLRLEVDYSDRRTDLVETGHDLAVRVGTLEDSRLVARRLCGIVHRVAASPGWWTEHSRPDAPDGLAGHAALCYRGSRVHRRWRWAGKDGATGTVAVEPRLVASNGEALVDAAVAGLGVLCEPDFVVDAAIDAGALEPVLTELVWETDAVQLVWPQGRPLAPRARDLVERLIDALGETPSGATLRGRDRP